MNLKQALKKEARLVGDIRRLFTYIENYNTVLESESHVISIHETLEKWKGLVEELIQLQTRIHTTNVPIHGQLFRIGALQKMRATLSNLKCFTGIPDHSSYFLGDEDANDMMVAEISIRERDDLLNKIDLEIHQIQNFLGKWNFETRLID